MDVRVLSFIEECLDWAIASASWCDLFSNAMVIHLLRACFDHLLILLELDANMALPTEW